MSKTVTTTTREYRTESWGLSVWTVTRTDGRIVDERQIGAAVGAAGVTYALGVA